MRNCCICSSNVGTVGRTRCKLLNRILREMKEQDKHNSVVPFISSKISGSKPYIIDLPYPVGRDTNTSLPRQKVSKASSCFSFKSIPICLATSTTVTRRASSPRSSLISAMAICVGARRAFIETSFAPIKFNKRYPLWHSTPINNLQNL